MLSYRTNDPKGWCGDPARGAALGRTDILDVPKDKPIKLVLRRLRMSADGAYDCNGTYWGCGDPLYWYAGEWTESDIDNVPYVDAVLRAHNRADAKRQIRVIYPMARFWN
jgi:hypothetical protein